MVLISIDSLSKSFSEKKVIDNISFSVEKGEMLSILGKSGVGKSVLIKLLAGLQKKDTGTVKFNDIEVNNIEQFTNTELPTIGFLFQQDALFDSLTVKENILMSYMNKSDLLNQESQAINQEILYLIDKLSLSKDVLNLYPISLSGGMKKRVAVIRTLIAKPDLIFLDEPTSGIDPVTSLIMMETINEHYQKYKPTIIMITHQIRMAIKLKCNIIFLDNAKISWKGSFLDLINKETLKTINNQNLVEFLNADI